MKRTVSTLAFMACLVTPAAAQWFGEPVWNSPKGGTGLTISGDYAKPDSSYGNGNVWGGRASLGLGTMTLTAGVSSWKPKGAIESSTSVGGNAAFRLIGGSLLPVAVNLQLGGARVSTGSGSPPGTRIIGAMGVSVPLPTPGFSIEPFFSPGLRYTNIGGVNGTKFGYAIGANVGFGLFGMHVAYDNEKDFSGSGSLGTFGVGAHFGIHLPMGM
ncbi:MAG TPA: hypothetical protein VFD76_06585 [Gemmatimonadales bacterium]|nr:hypothetical protein [Gemmatimonadales bacterium]